VLPSMPKVAGSEGHLFWLQKINIAKVLKGGSVIVVSI
jgi:hypothetical protein